MEGVGCVCPGEDCGGVRSLLSVGAIWEELGSTTRSDVFSSSGVILQNWRHKMHLVSETTSLHPICVIAEMGQIVCEDVPFLHSSHAISCTK